MKRMLIVDLALLTMFCFAACSKTNTIACPKCGYENTSGVKFCSECGAAMNSSSNNEQTNEESCQHSFGEWQETVSATCTNNGTKERVCSKCSYKETQNIVALGHTTTTGICSRCNQRVGWSKEELQNIVQVHDVCVDDINSAGGVDMRISWTNTSDKTIKYIHFYVVPYNAVGDQMYCDIRDYSRFDAYVTGPCEPGHQGYYKIGDIYYGNLWENCWYNNSIKTIQLVGIKIIYMDESVIDIEENDISKTIVEFSPLKEGYGIDEAFLEYYQDDENHRFYWAIDYLGVSVRPNVNIDVRIVNNNGVEVFYGEYYATSEKFTEISISGAKKWMIATSVYDYEIEARDVAYGTFYYHIYSDDGTIDLGEQSLSIDNLPIKLSETQELPTILRIGFSPDYEPYAYLDENGNLIGFDKDYITEIAKILGYESTAIEFIKVNQFDDLFTGLSINNYDLIISGIAETDERNQYFIASDSYISHTVTHNGDIVLDEPFISEYVIYGKQNQYLIEQVNLAIQTLKSNGITDSLIEKWLQS